MCGEGIKFDKRGREMVVGSWRFQNQLQVLEYSTGKLLHDIEPQAQCHYLTSVDTIGKFMFEK